MFLAAAIRNRHGGGMLEVGASVGSQLGNSGGSGWAQGT